MGSFSRIPLSYPAWAEAKPSGQCIGLAIRRSPARVPLRRLARFVLGRLEFKSSATLVNSQLVASQGF